MISYILSWLMSFFKSEETPSTPTCKYKDSEFQKCEIMLHRFHEYGWSARCADGTELTTSYTKISMDIAKKNNLKYFIMEKPKDERHCTDPKCIVRDVNKIYVRFISPFHTEDEENLEEGRFFPDEILEIIPLVLKRQGVSLGCRNAKLEEYKNEWKSESEMFDMTISYQELIDVMEDFDINKDLIAIVPDFELKFLLQHQSYNFDVTLNIYSWNGDRVTYPSLMMFSLFYGAVCGSNWKVDECTKHPNCKKNSKEFIIKRMKNLMEMDQNSLISLDYLVEVCQCLKQECFWSTSSYQSSPFSDPLFKKYKINENVPTETYKELMDHYELPPFDISNFRKHFPKSNELGIMMARAGVITRNVKKFFGKGNKQMQKVIMDCLEFSLPSGEKSDIKKFLKVDTCVPYKEQAKKISDKPIQIPKRIETSDRSKEKKHSNTEIRDFSAIKLGIDERDMKTTVLNVGEEFYSSNYAFLLEANFNVTPKNYFMINISHLDTIESNHEKRNEWEMSAKDFMTLESYTTVTNNYQFVIRTFPLLTGDDKVEEVSHVLLDDVLEILSLLLKRQEGNREENEVLLNSLRVPSQLNLSTAVTVEYFKNLLEIFDIDKRTITVIPDLIYQQAINKSVNDIYIPITTIDSKGNEVMSVSQAMLYTFVSLICGINWNSVALQNLTSMNKFKKTFFEVMDHYVQMSTTCFVSKEFVDKSMKELKNNEIIMKHQTIDRDYLWNSKTVYENVPIRKYRRDFIQFGLPNHLTTLDKVPVWTGRILFIIGWINSFYPENMKSHKLLLSEALCQKIPEDMRKYQGKRLIPLFKWLVLNGGVEIDRKCLEIKKESSEASSSEKCNRNVMRHKPVSTPSIVSKSQESLVDIRSIKGPDENSSRNECEKCYRTSQWCKTAQDGQKAAERKAEKYEKKAKRTEELEGIVKRMKQEMKELKKKDQKISGENEKMRKLEEENTKVQRQLVEEKQKNQTLDLRMKQLNSMMDAERLEMTLRQNHLEEDLARRDRTILELRERLAAQPEKYSSTSYSSESGLDTDTHCYICFEKFEGKLYVCKGCKKKTHEKCGSRWLLHDKSCPYCREKMLPPKTGSK